MTKRDTSQVGLSFFTQDNLRRPQIAEGVLDLLYRAGRDFAPEEMDIGQRWISLEEGNHSAVLEAWQRSINVLMRRERRYESQLAVSMGYAASGGINTFHLGVEEAYFSREGQINQFLQLCTKLYNLLSPKYGLIHQTHDVVEMATVMDPRYGSTVVPVDLRQGLPDVYWANFLGPEYVDKIGKPKLLAVPCHLVLALSDGGVLLVTTPSPLTPSQETSRAHRAVVRDYLGEVYFDPRIR